MEYPRYLKLPENYTRQKIEEYLLEDMPNGDITSSGTIPEESMSLAVLQAQQDLVLAGQDIITIAFSNCCGFELFSHDGDLIKNEDIIAKFTGKSRLLLARERLVLNLIQRLSGIATRTREYVEIAKPFGVKVLDTRKTTPGLRLFEKYAVAVGGGWNHRLDLSSGILIKDNHIMASGGIVNAVNNMKKLHSGFPIEIEIENFDQLGLALDSGIDGVLLDNMNPPVLIEAVKIIRSHPNGAKVFIEASGGITLDNFDAYVRTGVDAISVGALTHSVKSADMHMEIIA
jgi:nicotinate-nucleotide pyrophosphorylase (carboxylating)